MGMMDGMAQLADNPILCFRETPLRCGVPQANVKRSEMSLGAKGAFFRNVGSRFLGIIRNHSLTGLSWAGAGLKGTSAP
jgi:hypothetical protein